ncbi:MAG: alpha/beta hydrolase [Cyanobacteria bacterium P01_H01_bin.105]
MADDVNTIKYGLTIYLKNAEGDYITEIDRGLTNRYNWPKLGSEKVALQLLQLSGKEKHLCSGDTVKLKTSEPRAGDNDTLGKFSDSRDCYYWKENYDDKKQGWIINKVGGSKGDPINYDDSITITNIASKDEQLAEDDRYKGYITVKEGDSTVWSIEAVAQREIGENEWEDYYTEFDYLSHELVRKGCYPRIFEHETRPEKAIVLVQGLTDSPYFMTAIGEYFFYELEYNVYIPLLQGHGLSIPSGMEGVSLEEWKRNVNFAIETASEAADKVSIGGLSTGGALSCYMAATDDRINGALYLFSAALDIAGGTGNIKESLLRTFMADVLDKDCPLIGENPYRYMRMDNDGARELSRLIEDIDQLIANYNPRQPFSKPVFIAHSESDEAADIKGIEALVMKSNLDQVRFFRLRKKDNIGHAEVVLKEPVKNASGKVLEKPNPKFDKMMEAVKTFDEVIDRMAAIAASNTVDADLAAYFQLEMLKERIEDLPDADEADLIKFHRQALTDNDALIRYATIAQAVYELDDNPDAAHTKVRNKLNPLGCKLLEGSIRTDKRFDGLQAMCVTHSKDKNPNSMVVDELIVAYRGTNAKTDFVVDAGIGATLASPVSDNIVRNMIDREIKGKKTWVTFASMGVGKVTFSGQVGGRLVNAMKYFQDNVTDFQKYPKITIVGHSLGGYIAACVAYWARETYWQNIYGHTFNGAPGAKYALVASDDECDRNIANRIINHRIIGDSVSGPPEPIGTDLEGYPYAHLGYIYNWRPLVDDTLLSIDVHSLNQFIKDLECNTQHLVGVGDAPVGTYYW